MLRYKLILPKFRPLLNFFGVLVLGWGRVHLHSLLSLATLMIDSEVLCE